MYRRYVVIAALGALALLAAAGCGRRAASQTDDQKPKPPPPPTSTTLHQTTVKVADPQGQWTFEAVANTVTAASEAGPYDMQQARGTYRRPKEPPVHMVADRLHLDQAKEWVTLEGRVRLRSGSVTAEGERMQYNLKTGKVITAPRTKWTFTPGAAASEPKQVAADKGEHP